MDSEIPLESLMTRYQQGDSSAAAALVHRLSPQLHRFFAVQIISRRDADDLLQETWLRIHEVRHTYRPGEPLLPWFYAIARHIRIDHFRRALRVQMQTRELAEDMLPGESAPLPSAATPDLEALLAILPDTQREVVAMLKIAEMSLEDVARATGSSVGSVKQKAHRAYEKLREYLSRTGVRSLGKGARS
jgi:RNA polymerase sigma-70 factor (ECF subfamily)